MKGNPTINIHSYNVHQLNQLLIQEIPQITLNPFPKTRPTLRKPQQTAKTNENVQLKEPSSLNETCVLTSVHELALFYVISN